MKQEIFQVDAFTNQPFCGNPAGVTILNQPAEPTWMQEVAREMNLSETAFLVKQSDGFDLRWFTPAAEVDLCGHATLASAHMLWETGILKTDEQARFHTRSGLLTAEKKGDWIEMNFPAKLEKEIEPPPGLAAALGVQPSYVGRNQFDYLVEVNGEEIVRNLQPDISQLGKLPVRGTIITSRANLSQADQGFDFVSRFFAPAVGIPEDPVTGSAHSCLGPYWGKKLGKTEMLAYQASARGGVLRLRLEGERVILAGQAVTVLKATMV
jgi:PhzF family phenazine biosynthesis protein